MEEQTTEEQAIREFVDEQRAFYESMIPNAGAADPVAEVLSLEIPAKNPERSIPLRLYRPANLDAKAPVMLYIHGGGFASGSLNTHDVLARALANGIGALLFSIDYRLAPEHPFPAGLNDVSAALSWLTDHAEEFGGDPDRLVIGGDSAGGTLAIAASTRVRDAGGKQVRAQLLLYPLLTFATDSQSWKELGADHFPTLGIMPYFERAYVPQGQDATDPMISPLNGELKDLPPSIVLIGELDPLRDHARAYAESLEAAGVPVEFAVYPGVEHGFIQFFKDPAIGPQGKKALDDAVAGVKRALAAG
ncbi:alpha/beta hydrolase [Psychromicrobium sp. YIM B11713]|uniref:alpha/beta hydrolase n=1 Tax=Psychromicrobium sp. YIM B11713 TaxID=3145233 RepID=UPI00374ECE38